MATENLQAVSSANTKFSHDLHRALTHTAPNDNVVHSPFSLSAVLAMAKHGARNQTSLEIERACHFPNDETLAAGYKNLLAVIQDSNKGAQFDFVAANRLYLQHGFQIKSEFTSILQDSYFIDELKQLDFKQSAESAREINRWVEKVTAEKIKDLISLDSLNALTRLVLVNAIYFKGLWKNPFDKANTDKGTFHAIADGGSMREVQVDMMHLRKKFPYSELSDLQTQVVELLYKGDELAMLVFLPKEINGLQKLQNQSINHESLFAQMSSNIEIQLSLPRFRIESTHQLIEPLKKLALSTPFDPDMADFSGISDDVKLYVSAVVQKAFIEVNEEGTEAAAATGMTFGITCMPQIIEFTADHPFMFQIIHKPSHLLLFTGCVNDPTA